MLFVLDGRDSLRRVPMVGLPEALEVEGKLAVMLDRQQMDYLRGSICRICCNDHVEQQVVPRQVLTHIGCPEALHQTSHSLASLHGLWRSGEEAPPNARMALEVADDDRSELVQQPYIDLRRIAFRPIGADLGEVVLEVCRESDGGCAGRHGSTRLACAWRSRLDRPLELYEDLTRIASASRGDVSQAALDIVQQDEMNTFAFQ